MPIKNNNSFFMGIFVFEIWKPIINKNKFLTGFVVFCKIWKRIETKNIFLKKIYSFFVKVKNELKKRRYF